MTGTELVEQFKKHIAECNPQKPNWIEHSLIGYDPACETIHAAFHAKFSPASRPNIEVKRDSRIETVNGGFRDTLFGNGFRMVAKFYYPDKRFSKSAGATVKATLDVHDDRPSEFMLTVTVDNRDYYQGTNDVSTIQDVNKYLTDFLDSFFPEAGLPRWKKEILDKKLADIKNYCKRNHIKIIGKLDFTPEK